jgi:integrase/recombinase XerD
MKQAPVLNDRERQRMLQHLQRTSYAARNRCMLQLSWLAGMRVGEIAALDLGDVLAPNGEVRAEIQLRADQTKGDQARTVLVNSQLRAELERYVKTLNVRLEPKRPLIASKTGKRFSANGLCQRFLQLYDAAGLDKATSHSGRRTFITGLAHRGVNVRVLAALAGHRNIATTQRYIELNDAVLREAVELA